MEIKKEQFEDSEFLSMNDKYRIGKHFKRFVENDFARKDFNMHIYEHLHLHCGFIAHYNIDGFYQEYFNGNKNDLKRFAEHFVNFECMHYESVYNGANVNYEPYNDINKVFGDVLLENNVKKW